MANGPERPDCVAYTLRLNKKKSNVNGTLQDGIVRRTLMNVHLHRASTEAAASTKMLDTHVTALRSSSVTRVRITCATATNRRA